MKGHEALRFHFTSPFLPPPPPPTHSLLSPRIKDDKWVWHGGSMDGLMVVVVVAAGWRLGGLSSCPSPAAARTGSARPLDPAAKRRTVIHFHLDW